MRSALWIGLLALAGAASAQDPLDGTQVERREDGTVIETPYVDGVIHGVQIVRFASGNTWETPFVNGREHGTMIVRDSTGRIITARQFEHGERGAAQIGNGPCEFPGFYAGETGRYDAMWFRVSWCQLPGVGFGSVVAHSHQAEILQCRLNSQPPPANAVEIREGVRIACERLAELVRENGHGDCRCPEDYSR